MPPLLSFAFSAELALVLPVEAPCLSVHLQIITETYGLILIPALLEFPLSAVLSLVARNTLLKVVNN